MDNPMFLILGFLVIWIFIVILPSRKERQRKAQMQESLKKGDKVLVQAGCVGKVHRVDGDLVHLDFDGTKIPFVRSTVVKVIDQNEGAAVSAADLRQA